MVWIKALAIMLLAAVGAASLADGVFGALATLVMGMRASVDISPIINDTILGHIGPVAFGAFLLAGTTVLCRIWFPRT